MRYIETLREGERIQEIYLCRKMKKGAVWIAFVASGFVFLQPIFEFLLKVQATIRERGFVEDIF